MSVIISKNINDCLSNDSIIKSDKEISEFIINHKNGTKTTIKLGDKFNKLTVIKLVNFKNGIKKRSSVKGCICKCDCGNYIGPISIIKLATNHTGSCDCFTYKFIGNKNKKHGDAAENKTKLYKIWQSMKNRSKNLKTDHARYYAAKIPNCLCDEWRDDYLSFKTWAINNGYEENLSIDRIDNSKGYSPDNCRWIKPEEQARNKTNNIKLTYNGETKVLAEWSRERGLSRSVIKTRLRNGETVAQDLDFEKIKHNSKPRKKAIQKNANLLTYNKQTKTLSEWSRITGLSRPTILNRLKRGETMVQALGFEYIHRKGNSKYNIKNNDKEK